MRQPGGWRVAWSMLAWPCIYDSMLYATVIRAFGARGKESSDHRGHGA